MGVWLYLRRAGATGASAVVAAEQRSFFASLFGFAGFRRGFARFHLVIAACFDSTGAS